MIKVMIDSASDIGIEEAEKLGAIMVPITITFGDEEFYDGIDLNANAFYEKLVSSPVLPKTSLINTFRWEEEFEKHLGADDELIVITISQKLSGTYQSAVDASKKFNGRVKVVNTMSAAIGEHLLCLYALDLVKQGLSSDEIVALLEEKKDKIKIFALVGTLEYLKKGGRISSAVAFAGSLLSVKPVVGLVGGEVKLLGKAMGERKGFNAVNKLVQESNGIDFAMPFGTLYSGNTKDALDKYLACSTSLFEEYSSTIPTYQLGATIGTHVGPGAVGIAYFEK